MKEEPDARELESACSLNLIGVGKALQTSESLSQNPNRFGKFISVKNLSDFFHPRRLFQTGLSV